MKLLINFNFNISKSFNTHNIRHPINRMTTNYIIVVFIMLFYNCRAEVDEQDTSQYVVIPNRGVLLERYGTIFSHPQMNIMTAVITLDKLDYNETCDGLNLGTVTDNFNNQMKKYNEMTKAVFEAQNIFTSQEVCSILRGKIRNDDFCSQTKYNRKKRFVAAGAYVMAGAALGVATAAAGMAANNMVEIEKIHNYIKQHEQDISQLQQTLQNTRQRQDTIIDTQNSLLGYIQEMTITINELQKQVQCMTKYIYFQSWADELRREVENVLQFIFLGQTYGRLNPKLINPARLQQFIKSTSTITSVILSKYPNILYQTAMASLIDANFDQLQFTFLLTYPNFEQNPIYPYYTVHQIGFYALLPDEVEQRTCFMFSMPNAVVIHNNTLYTLLKPINCPSFGNVKICSNSQFRLFPLHECLQTKSKNVLNKTISREINCPLFQCIGEKSKKYGYVSTAGGILLRTRTKTIDIINNLPNHDLDLYGKATKTTWDIGQSGAIFIPWTQNVSSVVFDDEVVYSPINAQNFAHIRVSPQNDIARLDNSSLFAVPMLGTDKLSAIIQQQENRLQELENGIQPSLLSIKDWAFSQFTLPLWLKIALWVTCALVLIIIVKIVHDKLCPNYKCQRINSSDEAPHYEQVPQNMTTNQLYPSMTSILAQLQNDNNTNRQTTPTPNILELQSIPSIVVHTPQSQPPSNTRQSTRYRNLLPPVPNREDR